MTPEQHIRRVLIDNLTRERLLEVIAAHLHKGAKRSESTKCSTLRDWYRRSMRR